MGSKLVAAAVALSLSGAAPMAAAAAPILTDPLTGFAAAGFDPVAYFADGVAREGQAGIEATWEDVAWRFANEGNRAAFLADPDVYAPALGGHCPVSVARGYMAEGNPTVWTIHRDRLYFFHSEANREVFLREPDLVSADVAARWAR